MSEPAVELLRRAGVGLDAGNGRRLFQDAWAGRLRVLYVRAQDIPELVQEGRADVGITGLDLVLESGARVRRIMDLGFGHCRLVLAVPAKRRPGVNGRFSVATSFPRLTRSYLRRSGRRASVIPVSGATELMPHIGVADAVVDLTATGSTLAMNELVETDCLLDSTAWLVANRASLVAKKAAVDRLRFALETVVQARGKRYLMMDLPTHRVSDVGRIVPGIAGPTVMDIAGDPDTKAVHVVVEESRVYDVMRELKDLGARGVLVVPIDRMVA